ncbi:MAG: hypothetical protein HGA26_01145, partial [Chlorobiaceae bacterium]|nr:hypothetical protein [Chlorobiaceae bacterium]
LQPHIVNGYRDAGSGRYIPFSYAKRKLPISPPTFDLIHAGMLGVVEHGTGTLAKIPDLTVAGKTGTAQNPHGRDHAWFIAYAPAENPKIALAVLVENAGFGGTISAPIARELIKYYLIGDKPPAVPGADSTGTASNVQKPDSLQNGVKKVRPSAGMPLPAKPASPGVASKTAALPAASKPQVLKSSPKPAAPKPRPEPESAAIPAENSGNITEKEPE